MSLKSSALLALTAVLLAQSAATASLLYDSPGSSTLRTDTPTLGIEFTVGAVDVEVSALGIWDNNGDGLAKDHVVGLWTKSGAQVALVSFAPGSGTLGDQNFRFSNIDGGPVTLTAGSTYILAASYQTGAGDDPFQDKHDVTMGDLFESTYASYYGLGYGAKPGTGPYSGYWVGANLIAQPAPEPTTLGLLAIGSILGLGAKMRRRA